MIALAFIASGLVLGYLHSDWFYALAIVGIFFSQSLRALLGLPFYAAGVGLQVVALLLGGPILTKAAMDALISAGEKAREHKATRLAENGE